jgi:hypothetical protein
MPLHKLGETLKANSYSACIVVEWCTLFEFRCAVWVGKCFGLLVLSDEWFSLWSINHSFNLPTQEQ